MQPHLLSIYIFANNLSETLRFYRLLGLRIEEVSNNFARSTPSGGALIEFGTEELTRSYDPMWVQPAGPGTNTINFELPSRDAVDDAYRTLVDAGYSGHLPPCDAPWEARFAIIDDPNGNPVGLHSPRNLAEDRLREQN